MAVLVTEAVVLHGFDYLESSRILRLVTQEGGVRSVLARGARRSARRFGALDLFSQGAAQLHVKPGRDPHTLGALDVTRGRPALAADLARFMGAEMLAELTLRCAADGADEQVFAAVVGALDALVTAPPGQAPEAALAGTWHIIATLGFSPNVDVCSECHAPIAPDESVLFSHPAGCALCARCARRAVSGRLLPASARDALRAWTHGERTTLAEDTERRAHQRLLREFVREHLSDDRPLPAFEVWEHHGWDAPIAGA